MADTAKSKSLTITRSKSSQRSQIKDLIQARRQCGNTVQRLEVSFRRTIRVADNSDVNDLPPDMGPFPTYCTSTYEETLPADMNGKTGYFIPMYQREAMWINFKATHPFAIKVYAGSVNAISGEPARETGVTMMRRLKLMQDKKNIQDYVVAPNQLWLDGIATGDGRVRQFVAMPFGKGYTVEAQITGEEVIGGLQFEITPSKPPPGDINLSNRLCPMLKGRLPGKTFSSP